MGYEFDGKRYITRGINEKIPLEVQLMMFAGLDIMRSKSGELDHLQVFRLETIDKDGVFTLHIHHEQEVPEAKMDYIYPVNERIDEKVYIIDSEEYVTMLLAEEY